MLGFDRFDLFFRNFIIDFIFVSEVLYERSCSTKEAVQALTPTPYRGSFLLESNYVFKSVPLL